jgi:hypothetical protein
MGVNFWQIQEFITTCKEHGIMKIIGGVHRTKLLCICFSVSTKTFYNTILKFMGKRPIFNPSHIQDLMKEFNHIFDHIGFNIENNEREKNKHSKLINGSLFLSFSHLITYAFISRIEWSNCFPFIFFNELTIKYVVRFPLGL